MLIPKDKLFKKGVELFVFGKRGKIKDEYKSKEAIAGKINELLIKYHKFITKILIGENKDTQKVCEEKYIESIKSIINNNPIYSQLLEVIKREDKSYSVYYFVFIKIGY